MEFKLEIWIFTYVRVSDLKETLKEAWAAAFFCTISKDLKAYASVLLLIVQ